MSFEISNQFFGKRQNGKWEKKSQSNGYHWSIVMSIDCSVDAKWMMYRKAKRTGVKCRCQCQQPSSLCCTVCLLNTKVSPSSAQLRGQVNTLTRQAGRKLEHKYPTGTVKKWDKTGQKKVNRLFWSWPEWPVYLRAVCVYVCALTKSLGYTVVSTKFKRACAF